MSKINRFITFLRYEKFKEQYSLYLPRLPEILWKIIFFFFRRREYFLITIISVILFFIQYNHLVSVNGLLLTSLLFFFSKLVFTEAAILRDNEIFKVRHLDYYRSTLFTKEEQRQLISNLSFYYMKEELFVFIPFVFYFVFLQVTDSVAVVDYVLFPAVVVSFLFSVWKVCIYHLELEEYSKKEKKPTVYLLFFSLLILVKLFLLLGVNVSFEHFTISKIIELLSNRTISLLMIISFAWVQLGIKMVQIKQKDKRLNHVNFFLKHLKSLNRDLFFQEVQATIGFISGMIILSFLLPMTTQTKNGILTLVLVFFISPFNSKYLVNEKYLSYLKITQKTYRSLWLIFKRTFWLQITIVMTLTLLLNENLESALCYFFVNTLLFLIAMFLLFVLYGVVLSSKHTDRMKLKLLEITFFIPIVLMTLFLVWRGK
ncbi:hypothetical protein SAMN02745116_00595 [Pilibacter termitis]|uniref:Uncharacterized protein n=1 Tax=Pilibacter termitis TaxID=263852 RepID=A0A1T4LB62_9ENTE|nr:hypothetical protein [Pilibacter termitis]SJZ51841.1 hypothetical protein SAMN02745116_00595 [Pilibacter termitis]